MSSLANRKAAKNAKHHVRTIGTLKAYNFKDKDPQIDELRTKVEKKYGRRIDHAMMQDCSDNGGASVGAMVGWFMKDTKSPRNETLEASGRAWGFRRKWVTLSDE